MFKCHLMVPGLQTETPDCFPNPLDFSLPSSWERRLNSHKPSLRENTQHSCCFATQNPAVPVVVLLLDPNRRCHIINIPAPRYYEHATRLISGLLCFLWGETRFCQQTELMLNIKGKSARRAEGWRVWCPGWGPKTGIVSLNIVSWYCLYRPSHLFTAGKFKKQHTSCKLSWANAVRWSVSRLVFIPHVEDDKNLSILCRVIVQIVTKWREHAKKFQKGSQGSFRTLWQYCQKWGKVQRLISPRCL